MILKYMLISLVIGIIFGISISLFYNKKIHKYKSNKNKLKNKDEFKDLYEKLIGHFNFTIKLLDNISKDCHQLCKYMEKYQDIILSNKKDNSQYRITETEADNDQIPIEMSSKK